MIYHIYMPRKMKWHHNNVFRQDLLSYLKYEEFNLCGKGVLPVAHCYRIIVCSVLFLTLQILTVAQDKPFFEEGIIKTPSYKGELHAYPIINRTSDGNLITVWSHRPGDNSKNKIIGSLSKDNGKTWSESFDVLDVPERSDGDPCIIVDGDRILVYSTTVLPPNRITKADIWMVESRDEGQT